MYLFRRNQFNSSEKHLDTIAKVNYIFMQHLMDMLNIKMVFSVTNSWGYKDENIGWTGLIGELITKRAEIGG